MHVSYGVVTAGLTSDRLTLEASVFNGLEPDSRRWNVERMRFDSYAVRLRLQPRDSLFFQTSFANLAQPERLHPTIGLVKLSLSATSVRAVRGGSWYTTLAFGRNKSKRTLISLVDAQAKFTAPVLAHYVLIGGTADIPPEFVTLVFPARVQSGWLVESALRKRTFTAFGRLERVNKDELFDPLDSRHSTIFAVAKASIGASRLLTARGGIETHLGAVGSVHWPPDALRLAYGNRPVSFQMFLRVAAGHSSPAAHNSSGMAGH
jgi:hypothetical protein